MTTNLFPIFVKSGSKSSQMRAGFINAVGESVIDPIFDRVGSFREGLAPVQVKGKWGLIDAAGKMVIEPFSDRSISFSEGRGIFSEGSKCGVIDRSGNVIVSPKGFIAKFEWAELGGWSWLG
jgi:WG containing repeat